MDGLKKRRSWGDRRRAGAAVLLAAMLAAAAGCRLSPGSLAGMVVGDLINDADVENRKDELIGKGPEAADEMFGVREDTLVGTEGDRLIILYPVKGDIAKLYTWVVEVSGGEIYAVSKAQRYADAGEDIIREGVLKDKLIGRTPEECSEVDVLPGQKLGEPMWTLRSKPTADMVRVYDVRNLTNIRGARWCVLRFGDDGRCKKINLIGISGTTKPYEPPKA